MNGPQVLDLSDKGISSHVPQVHNNAFAPHVAQPVVQNAPVSNEDGIAATMANFTPSFLQGARNPTVCLFHLLFKALSIFFFIFGGLIGLNYILIFVCTTLCLAFDFWTVKNVTGRVLVGLRWWNDISEDGTSEWKFESHPELANNVDPINRIVFWSALCAWPLVWTLFLFIHIISFRVEWLLLLSMAVLLSSSNLIGYWKCSKDAGNWARSQAFSALTSVALGSLMKGAEEGGNTNNNNQQQSNNQTKTFAGSYL